MTTTAVTCFSFTDRIDLGPSNDGHPETSPEATRCRSCEGTGMVQCDACFLFDAVCDACGEPADVLADDGTARGLPLCLACNAEAA